jgi:hypothetical protein
VDDRGKWEDNIKGALKDTVWLTGWQLAQECPMMSSGITGHIGGLVTISSSYVNLLSQLTAWNRSKNKYGECKVGLTKSPTEQRHTLIRRKGVYCNPCAAMAKDNDSCILFYHINIRHSLKSLLLCL